MDLHVFTPESLQRSVETLIGKPLVVYVDGERYVIGEVTRAVVKGEALFFSATMEGTKVEGRLE